MDLPAFDPVNNSVMYYNSWVATMKRLKEVTADLAAMTAERDEVLDWYRRMRFAHDEQDGTYTTGAIIAMLDEFDKFCPLLLARYQPAEGGK